MRAPTHPIHTAEAAQLAQMFSLDYLSWDHDQPAQRADVLHRYLPSDADTTHGWSGEGRQRAEVACVGRIEPDGDRLLVDVRVRVTLYEPVKPTAEPSEREETTDAQPPEGTVWSSAPPPAADGWEPGRSLWWRLTVPVRRHDASRLVVDVDLSAHAEPNDHAEGRDR